MDVVPLIEDEQPLSPQISNQTIRILHVKVERQADEVLAEFLSAVDFIVATIAPP